MTTQRPVPQNEIPTNFLLTEVEKQQKVPSGILPSGQENYFDTKQNPNNNGGFPINAFYPSPKNPDGSFSGTPLLATSFSNELPPEIRRIIGQLKETGILHYENLIGRFSNATSTFSVQDFNIFNPYVHYYSSENQSPVLIPYVSDYEVVLPISPY